MRDVATFVHTQALASLLDTVKGQPKRAPTAVQKAALSNEAAALIARVEEARGATADALAARALRHAGWALELAGEAAAGRLQPLLRAAAVARAPAARAVCLAYEARALLQARRVAAADRLLAHGGVDDVCMQVGGGDQGCR